MNGVIDIQYEVGLISLATVYGLVKLPSGVFPGEKTKSKNFCTMYIIPRRC